MTATALDPSRPARLPPPEEFARLTPEEIVQLVRSGRGRDAASRAERLRALVVLSRPRTWPASVLVFALGAHFAGTSALTWRIVAAIVVTMLIVLAANVQNAYSDLEEDARNIPGRVYLLAQLGYDSLLRMTLVTTAAVVCLAALVSGRFLATAIISAIGLAEYSFPPVRAKARPALGVFVFSQAIGFPLLLGWYAASSSPPVRDRALVALWIFLTALWIAKGMFKNVPDFYGDAAAGLRTSATVFGSWRRAALAVGAATVTAYGFLVAIIAAGELPRIAAAALVVVPIALWDIKRLVAAEDGAEGNRLLRLDMAVSCLFLGMLMLLLAPTAVSALAAGLTVVLFLVGDLLQLDSRRQQDVGVSATS
jgi:4-hydroxybenzoate polyprenyltransferase